MQWIKKHKTVSIVILLVISIVGLILIADQLIFGEVREHMQRDERIIEQVSSEIRPLLDTKYKFVDSNLFIGSCLDVCSYNELMYNLPNDAKLDESLVEKTEADIYKILETVGYTESNDYTKRYRDGSVMITVSAFTPVQYSSFVHTPIIVKISPQTR